MTFSQQPPSRGLALLGLTLASLMLACSAAAADKNMHSGDPEAQYQRDKQACTSGQSSQDRATCLREAGAAYQQARQGKLGNAPATSYRQNALARCQALPPEDRPDCQRRIENPSDIEGSVSTGGILRKDVTIVPAPAQ